MHVSGSGSVSMSRWRVNSFLIQALTAASNIGVSSLRYRVLKGLLYARVTLTVEGESEAVSEFGEWIEKMARFNS